MMAAKRGGMTKANAKTLPPPTLIAVTTTVPLTAIVVALVLEATRAAVVPKASSRPFAELLKVQGGSLLVESHNVSWHIVSNQPSVPLFWDSSCQLAAA